MPILTARNILTTTTARKRWFAPVLGAQAPAGAVQPSAGSVPGLAVPLRAAGAGDPVPLAGRALPSGGGPYGAAAQQTRAARVPAHSPPLL
eukprot:CAMPEP_0177751054 /NCGR_PEP_ID=MMETSP0491_2-20121128/168_1 /TAXON_ID=63592 /ORGANISM="Tetraselmis chuii, Strain PLY429" /LENGTH=90 /DNA_ID=CAMNT_0019266139 /DNA_START=1798 /DNA_END=2070 /DNA_ORIENTATION=+